MLEKTVLITGGAKGIGKAIALAFAKEKYNVVFTYLGSKQKAEETKRDCEKLTNRVMTKQCDITNIDDVSQLITEVIDAFSNIDVLVNNAGITKDNLLLRMQQEEFDDVINTNLKGTFNVIKQVSKGMFKLKKGKIINISSVVAITGNVGQANYAASKAGMIGLSKTVAKELANRNITCNVVAPGFIQTTMTDSLSDSIKDSIIRNIPLKRFGNGDDVAQMVLFLASNKADYITGQTFVVDGGLSISGGI